MHRITFAATAAFFALGASCSALAAPAEICDVLVQQENGDISELTAGGYSVIEKTAAADYTIVPGPGAKLLGFICDRSDIVPADNDWKVLQQGYKLHIRANGLEGMLTLSDGEVKYRLTDRKARMGSMASGRVDEQLTKFQAQLAAHPAVAPMPAQPVPPPAPPAPPADAAPASDAAPAETPAADTPPAAPPGQ